ncbi:hypothetical protein CLOP_g1724 [Closterium sp. NIES-67]|nr:hypothetical protein CLOP_g1724 [Closterium sp. NIES-67]
MDLTVLIAFVVFISAALLVFAFRLSRVMWLEEQAERARERARALRERAARSRLAEGMDPKLIGSFSDLVTFADAKVERAAAARGGAPSSDCVDGLVTQAGVTVAEVNLPRHDMASCVGAVSLEEGGEAVVDIGGESPRRAACPATGDGRAAGGGHKNGRLLDGLSAVQGEESTAVRGTPQDESGADADKRVSPPSDASSERCSPSDGERQGSPPAVVLAGESGRAAVGDGGSVGDAANVVISMTSAECSVCLVEFEDDVMLRRMHCCRHLFHQDCLEKWLEYRLSCPICRVQVKELLLIV